jgi:competence protein ComEC
MQKRSASMVLVFVLLLGCQAYLLLPAQSESSPILVATSCPEDVTLYFLDVGQGDSILVKTASKNILIDGGPTSAGKGVVSALQAYNVSRIDLMVATHPHADHIGGLITVLQSTIEVQDIIYNGYNYTSITTFNNWKNLALTHNLTQASRGQVHAMSPTINFTVLSPTGPTQFSTDLNAQSIVMKLQVGNTSVLFTGDAQSDTEQFLVSSGSDLSSLILKVGHHGSSTSTSQAFLTEVNPTYAVISAGIDNTYGHPTQRTLKILSDNNVQIYGTYESGTIVFSLNSASESLPSTASPSPTPTPTPSPISPESPTPTASTNPTSPTQNPIATSPTPTPIPEFPITAILIAVLVFVSLLLVIGRRRLTLRG